MPVGVALGACTGSLNDGGSGAGHGSTGSNNTATGLPCDVADVINAKCASCHSNPPTAGAPTPLLSASDLQAKAKTDPSVTMAQQSVKRMQAASGPMPPGGGATPADVAAFQKWIDSGYAQGDCGGTSQPDPAFTGMSVCTSGKVCSSDPATCIDQADRTQMEPGVACNQCHGTSTPKRVVFAAAGTVYPTGHEPALCSGVDGSAMADVVVVLTGADGVEHRVRPNQAGNFIYDDYCANNACFQYKDSGTLTFPYRARVESSKGVRVMSEPQMDGDCNLCHTDAPGGNGSAAAGRIVIPY